MNSLVIVFDYFGLLLLFVLMLLTIIKCHWFKKYVNWFRTVLACSFFATFFEIASYNCLRLEFSHSVLFSKIFIAIAYYLAVIFSIFLFNIVSVIFYKKTYTKNYKKFSIFGYTVFFVINFIGIFQKNLISYDGTNLVVLNLYILNFLGILLYGIPTLVVIIKNIKDISRLIIVSAFTYLFAIVIQFVYMFYRPGIVLYSFFISILIFFLYLTVFTMDGYQEDGLPIYSYEGLEKNLFYELKEKNFFRYCYVFEIGNVASYEVDTTDKMTSNVKTVIGRKLVDIFKRNVFSISETRYLAYSKNSIENVIKKNFIDNKVHVSVMGKDLAIEIKVAKFIIPTDFSETHEILNAVNDDTFVHLYESNEIVKISKEMVQRKREQSLKENIIREELINKSIILLVKPVYEKIKSTVTGLEFSLKIKGYDLDLDDIYELSKNGGFLNKLEDYFLEQIDIFTKNNDLTKHGINHLFIRLNSTGFSLDKRSDTILNLFNKDVYRNKVTILVKEVAGIFDEKSILNNITKLKNVGIKIYLDEYGSGYSTLDYILRFPFDGIKARSVFTSNNKECKESLLILNYITSVSKKIGCELFLSKYDSNLNCDLINNVNVNFVTGRIYGEYTNSSSFFKN